MIYMTRVLVCSALLLVFSGSARPQSPIFNFYDDEFWLNLHHFLYVLGRAENKTRDSSRAAVSGAPADQPPTDFLMH